MGVGLLAFAAAAIFFGAAFYINFAEHPARRRIAIKDALQQWASSYRRGFAMQSSLAIASAALGVGAWWMYGGPFWLGGAVLMLANWPYTLAVIMPVNRRLLDITPEVADQRAWQLLDSWNRLHAGRTMLSALGMACYFVASRSA